ncbi:MAG: hypothetical protein J0I09_03670 [Sphingobacteriia bacterium]|nr:hypothetical protein [Sphingobacteriia bacterium]
MNIDTPAQNDLLNRKDFAIRIAKGIWETSLRETDGFVIGVTGRWGSGKSTLLTYIKEHLSKSDSDSKNSSILVDFNPWMFSEEENIKKGFLKSFLFEIKPELKKKKTKQTWWLTVCSFFKKSEIINVPGGEISKDIINLFLKYIEQDTSTYYKASIDKILLKSNKKIFVIIDDIDRLYPKQVFEILQVLKLTGNFKNVFYIVAFDREAVELSIETQFKDYGKKYLEKIIQADFVIPEVSDEKIEKIFFNQLNELFKNLEIQFNSSKLSSLWLHKGLKYYFKTLREIYRFINSIQFTLPHIADDIYISDFIVIETLRLYEFEVYQLIYNVVSLQIATYSMSGNFDSELIDKPEAKNLVKYLFSNIHDEEEKNAKRLKDPQYFSRYFTLQVNASDITEKEFATFFESPNKQDVLHNILGFGRLDNLLVRLNDDQILSSYSNWNFHLVRDLYTFLNNQAEDFDGKITRFADAIINLLSVKQKERNQYFNEFIELLYSESLSSFKPLVIYFYHFMVLDKESNTGFSGNSSSFRQFYLYQHDLLKSRYYDFLKRGESFYLGGAIHRPSSYFTMLFIYDYARFFKKEYMAFLSPLLSNRNSLIFFIKNVVVINANDNKAFELDTKKIKHYLPEVYFDKFIEKLRIMDITNLNEDEKGWRDFILAKVEEKNKSDN